ncbi:MAG: MFS transporter [Microbacteriaceae bacterium]|nr:MFS transporter [Microbacteriaceae bacterium]
MTIAEAPFRWKTVALPVFLPTLLFSTGEGAILPIIATRADSLGASLAIAGLIAAMIMLGTLIGDIPSGWLVSRIGERTSMIGAALVAAVGLLLATFATNLWLLGVGILLVGLATAVFALARHAFLTSFVPQAIRARALSTLGGTFRLGYFVGPFLAALVIHLTGSTAAVFVIHIVGCLGSALILLLLKDPAAGFSTPRNALQQRVGGGANDMAGDGVGADTNPAGSLSAGPTLVAQESVGLFATLRANRGVLSRLGSGAALVGALRASRAVILPLWAVSIGLGGSNTALIIGIAGAVDFALFYASGQIMDRFGRLWSAVPSMVGLGLGHIALAVSHDLPGNVVWFITVAMFLSVANGIGSGILMTLGADLADKNNPAPFLGAWRFTGDLGGAAAPLMVSVVTAIASLAVATAILGVAGIVGAAILLRYVPQYLPHTSRSSRLRSP